MINRLGKSICGRIAINKSMQGKSCSCCLLPVPGFPAPTPPQARHVEKLETCPHDGAIQACTNSLVPTSVALRDHLNCTFWKHNPFQHTNQAFQGLFLPFLPLSGPRGRRQETAMFRLTLQSLPLDVWYPNKPLLHCAAERHFSWGVLGEPAALPALPKAGPGRVMGQGRVWGRKNMCSWGRRNSYSPHRNLSHTDRSCPAHRAGSRQDCREGRTGESIK